MSRGSLLFFASLPPLLSHRGEALSKEMAAEEKGEEEEGEERSLLFVSSPSLCPFLSCFAVCLKGEREGASTQKTLSRPCLDRGQVMVEAFGFDSFGQFRSGWGIPSLVG